MAELRRLIISNDRLKDSSYKDNLVALRPSESHYISRVMRYKFGDRLHIVDGIGNLWLSQIISPSAIKLLCDFDKPILHEPRPKTLTGLAVVVPKQGFDDVLRMSCELGIDFLQPLYSDHSVLKDINEGRFMRWENILNESIEQSERLWRPQIRICVDFSEWLTNDTAADGIAFCTPRLKSSVLIESYFQSLSDDLTCVWALIGPEGGWSKSEVALAINKGCTNVKLSNYILRTSTASIAATQAMMSWRRSLSCKR